MTNHSLSALFLLLVLLFSIATIPVSADKPPMTGIESPALREILEAIHESDTEEKNTPAVAVELAALIYAASRLSVPGQDYLASVLDNWIHRASNGEPPPTEEEMENQIMDVFCLEIPDVYCFMRNLE